MILGADEPLHLNSQSKVLEKDTDVGVTSVRNEEEFKPDCGEERELAGEGGGEGGGEDEGDDEEETSL